MKRACLVTYYGDNYGACLQAYAMQEILKKEGYAVEILNYKYNRARKRLLNKLPQYLASIPHVVLSYSKIMDHRSKLCLRDAAFRRFREEKLQIMREAVCSIETIAANEWAFDLYVAGSDQIWNPTFYNCCNPVYYLDFVPKDKRTLSYASSIGISVMPEEYRSEFRRMISKIDYVSVREMAGVQIIRSICNREVPAVLDPTLLMPAEQWDLVCSDPIVQDDYVFCYLFSGNPQYKAIKRIMKKRLRCKIVSIPFAFREIEDDDEKIYDAGPAEFISLIKHAKFIITDSFHATAFSINYQKPFLALERQKKTLKTNMNSRMYSVLDMFGLRSRLIHPLMKAEEMEKLTEINYNAVCQILDKQRKYSYEFLKGALHG